LVLIMEGNDMYDGLSGAEIQSVAEHFDLSEGNECPLALWIIGRPAAGKTTTASLLKDLLRRARYRVELVDGDAVRAILDGVYGFSVSDRLAVFKKYVHLNQILQSRGIIPITATIGGFRESRDIARSNLNNSRFVYLDCPFDVAAQRDNKGNYARALGGQLANFFGVDISFEEVIECEMRIESAILKPTEIVARIIEHLNHAGLLRKISGI